MQRLARGQAVFETRADNLQATLERIAADLGSSSAAIDRAVTEDSGFWPDFSADDLFYANKGRLYAYYLLLRELEVDFANVIRERDLGAAWTQMLDTFREAATLQPWVVVNGDPASQFLPSHLARAGLLPAARPHPAQRDHQHPAQMIGLRPGRLARPPGGTACARARLGPC